VKYKGVNYDTGIRYTPDYLTLAVFDESSIRRDMGVMAGQLHGNSVIFSETSNPHSASPEHDLDTASHGIVKVMPTVEGEPPRWEPKEAFDEVDRRFGSVS
jgi:hypothetical protein